MPRLLGETLLYFDSVSRGGGGHCCFFFRSDFGRYCLCDVDSTLKRHCSPIQIQKTGHYHHQGDIQDPAQSLSPGESITTATITTICAFPLSLSSQTPIIKKAFLGLDGVTLRERARERERVLRIKTGGFRESRS